MGKIESTIKSEIQRLSKREIRATFLPLRREVRAIRLKLSGLSKSFHTLDRLAKEKLQQVAKEPKLEASPEEIKASRLTPDRIRRLRKKLGISMRELGVLTGSSLSAVVSWESGKFKPGGGKKAALVALRKARKREVRKMLAEKAEAAEKAKEKPAAKGRRGKKGAARGEKPAARRQKAAATRLRKAA